MKSIQDDLTNTLFFAVFPLYAHCFVNNQKGKLSISINFIHHPQKQKKTHT